MSTSEKGIGIAAIIMALCCAVLPLAGGALATTASPTTRTRSMHWWPRSPLAVGGYASS